MTLRSLATPALVAAWLLAGGARAETVPASGPMNFAEHVKPLLKQYCADCHNAEKSKGDLDLTPHIEGGKLVEDRKVWEKVIELMESREMPPEKKPQPSEGQRDTIIKFLDGQLSKADCETTKNPGRVTIRRLNRDEYHNTVRDLLGVEYWPADFPSDEIGYGFDNIGDVLSLSPMLMEKYLAVAETITGKAIVADAQPKPFVKRFRGDKFSSPNEWVRPLESRVLGLYREGEATTELNAPVRADYTLRIRAYGEQAGPEAPKMRVSVAGRELKVFEVPNEKGKIFEVTTPLEAGPHKIAVGYLNNYNEKGDRNLFVDYVEVQGPPIAPDIKLPESHTRLITRMPKPGEEHAVGRELLAAFAKRAYRRPVADAEVERLTRFVDLAVSRGGGFLEGMQLAVQAALCSPHFLYRWELDPPAMKAGESRDLTDLEVASRLSYFLWSSLPDAELAGLAEKGELLKDGNLEKQAVRLLKDWRARTFASCFASQWLQVRGIWTVAIDPKTFGKWDDSLKAAMMEETILFFQAIMQEDRPVTDLLDADFTFLNEKLARHYGIEGVTGEEFRRVALKPESHRGGVLTLGSVLVSTSTPTRTSPVIRGKWMLEQILGTPPPPPPADVPPLPEQAPLDQTASLRQRLEQHRSQAECAGCHAKMDPLGFALENFDATGAWRETDGKYPIDASGKLANGTAFTGAADLRAVLKGGNKFTRSLAMKMTTYALGRGLEYSDRCAVDALVAKIGTQGNRFSALVTGIVTSEPFLKRRLDSALTQN